VHKIDSDVEYIPISNEKYFEYSRTLEEHHSLFYKMWELGKPCFTNTIQTAAVVFSNGDYIQYLFNPDFWHSINEYDRMFVISHECLHVILNHGWRTINAKNPRKCNIALDIVVNHMLINKFGFDKNKLSIYKDLCLVETVFPDQNVPENECFEYYYNKLIEQDEENGSDGENGDGPNSLDDHSKLADAIKSGDLQSVIDKVKDFLERELTEEEKETIEKMLARGDEAGNIFKVVTAERKIKKKWETVIKKWSKKYDKTDLQDVEQWARINRRYSNIKGNLFLPSDMEIEHEIDGKIDVWFFQDTSGSCAHLAQRFFKAAKSLSPLRFDIRMFCFDTRVYETSIASGKLYGFGGTSFSIIENHIQNEIKTNKVKYPKAVFVITDGYGDYVKIAPEQCKKWHWFLSTGYNFCIPKTCNIHQLSNFE
jgi:predicted metal-dependent peptidase